MRREGKREREEMENCHVDNWAGRPRCPALLYDMFTFFYKSGPGFGGLGGIMRRAVWGSWKQGFLSLSRG